MTNSTLAKHATETDRQTVPEHIYQSLREAGQRITKEREALITTLFESDKALTPYELHNMSSKHAEVGLTTTYRLLETLLKNNFVEVFLVQGELRYGLCKPSHHHHLVCTTCFKMRDFDQCDFNTLKIVDFASSGHRLEIFGTCSDCSNSAVRKTL